MPKSRKNKAERPLNDLAKRILSRFEPAPDLVLADWAEENIVLPESARPGKYRNWPYLREVLNSIGDRKTERVTVMKPTRVGYTKGLMVAIGASAARNPASIGLLVPTDDDARRYAVQEVEPIFEATPALSALLRRGRNDGRNTMLRRSFLGGGRLTILPTRSPRNLRAHDFKFLFCDEVDAWELTDEGDPLPIAEKRTLAHADRKIVVGGTPTEDEISVVDRQYQRSDQRIYELRCPHCEDWFELLWEHVQWPDKEGVLGHPTDGDFARAAAYCPRCGGEIEERLKVHLVSEGRWRATKPEVESHRGYRMNALISLLPNATWSKLAAEYVAARRGGPAEMQVFYNTVLGKTWKTTLNRVSAEILASRTEEFGLDSIPAWVLAITVGADVQDDRIEATVIGWGLKNEMAVLGHVTIDGSTLDDETWKDFDRFLRGRWRHPKGWEMRVDACAVDSGGHEGRTQKVYDFCASRSARRIFAIAARPGARPVWKRAEKVKGNARLFIVGHDQVKTAVMELLANEPFDAEGRPNPHAIRLSDDLDEDWFDQATGEVRRIRYVRNRAVIKFEPKRSGQRVEALDCLCYGYAVRHSPAMRAFDLNERAAREPDPVTGEVKVKRKRPGDWAAQFNG